MSSHQAALKPKLIDLATKFLIEWDAKATGEKRHGKINVELTYGDNGAVLMREAIDFTTK